jgi:hypothetical protein
MVRDAGVSAEGIRLARLASIWRRSMAAEGIITIFALCSLYKCGPVNQVLPQWQCKQPNFVEKKSVISSKNL